MTNWTDRAACKGADAAVFFPSTRQIGPKAIREAKTYCDICKVSEQCLYYAIKTESNYGVFGGKTPNERSKLSINMRRSSV
jgi:WhiB family redox-sensing transcriptional regulator